jgi:phosphomannomutase
MTIDEALAARVRAWIDDDPDLESQAELSALLEAGDAPELQDRFAGELEFGTAGLRGVIGAGPRRMNRAVVARATAGLCAQLLADVPDAAERGLCIGYDGRRLSQAFAEEVAAVAAGAGLRVHRFARTVPTPLLAFAVRHRGAAGGVMVTASHNPPAYNGYKVYWDHGAQITPPLDEAIAARIGAVPSARALPRMGPEDRARAGREASLGDDVVSAYRAGVQRLLPGPFPHRDITIVHTSLHGVGAPEVRAVLRDAGFEAVHEVAAQAEPDPTFPTVAFPNPEEPGAMDMALALARERDADLVLANDPDGDRLAVAVRDGEGGHVLLSGNDIGCLLGDHLLTHGPTGGRRLVVCTIVSSPLLGAIAQAHGALFEQTLTGFKWIARRAMELEQQQDARFVFGYEEALGYCAGTLVRDKDGVSAALLMADLAARCHREGRTLLDALETLARHHGLFVSRQVSHVDAERGGLARIAALSEQARQAPPRVLGDVPVTAVADVRSGVRTATGGERTQLTLPPSDLLIFELEGGHRAMLRPSGTEPKLKYYVDVRMPVGAGEPIEGARQRGEALANRIAADLRAHVEERTAI